MNEYEILCMLRDIVSVSYKMISKPDDPSGCFTEWVVDQEKMMEELEKRIKVCERHDMIE